MSPTALAEVLATSASQPLDAECLPNYELIVTEDDTPVENLFSERQPTLLTDSLYASKSVLSDGRTFVSMGNVGLFFAVKQPPLVPDFLLSFDVEVPDNILPKENRSYFIWNYGKPPDLVIEIVSNKEGGEADVKPRMYAKIGVTYYVILDPLDLLGGGVLQVFALHGRAYEPVAADFLPDIGLGLVLWDGTYAGASAQWLRWCDHSGQLLLTSEERADQERQRADLEEQRADEAQERAEQAQERANRLAAQLKSLGIEPGK